MPYVPDDLTLISIRSAVDHLHSTLNRALQRIDRKVQSEHSDLFSDIRKQRKLVSELGLDHRLVGLYKALVAQGSFQRPDAIKDSSRLLHCQLEQVVVTQSGAESKVRFLLNSHPYELVYLDDGGGKISFYGETFSSSHLTLRTHQEEALITLHLTLEGEGSHESCSISQISGFIPGAWIYDIIHGYEMLMTAQKLNGIRDSYSEQRLRSLKKRFGLDDQ